ncbi:MarR family transcriptional regulator [Streptomyces sp. C11-1]|uniref:MarR family transcriptional regulator n=1 Tax=Streptomyces durocortorensis TaxID=2811104 RepID=A0ABY9VWA5_9ACTN|nr:MarR family transcriptional regulator [Streptomyces durocortorensis]WNF27893.1 MarR family transcriptional regulator [Streptomyces durocortorensis]
MSERAGEVPSRQELLSRAALTVFRLNGQFLAVADELAEPGGLTAARWQVLGAVLPEPLPVAGIARAMGITRQSVQRIADLLVEQGLAEYAENPAHRRAKLLRVTGAGRDAVSRIDPAHAEFAARLAGELGAEGFAEAVGALERLSGAVGALTAAQAYGPGAGAGAGSGAGAAPAPAPAPASGAEPGHRPSPSGA